jgi:hypothetical protein
MRTTPSVRCSTGAVVIGRRVFVLTDPSRVAQGNRVTHLLYDVVGADPKIS